MDEPEIVVNGSLVDATDLARIDQLLRGVGGKATTPQKPPELTFTRIEPQNLHLVWPWVLRGLKIVKERVYGRATYTPAHIRNAVFANQANLHVVYENEQPVAFAVITVQNDPFLGVPTTLQVWCEYSEAKTRAAADFAHKEIIALGKMLCLTKIQMMSPRDAWERRLVKINMKPVMTTYELALFPDEEED